MASNLEEDHFIPNNNSNPARPLSPLSKPSDLNQLQSLVQDQLTKASNFKTKIENQLKELNSINAAALDKKTRFEEERQQGLSTSNTQLPPVLGHPSFPLEIGTGSLVLSKSLNSLPPMSMKSNRNGGNHNPIGTNNSLIGTGLSQESSFIINHLGDGNNNSTWNTNSSVMTSNGFPNSESQVKIAIPIPKSANKNQRNGSIEPLHAHHQLLMNYSARASSRGSSRQGKKIKRVSVHTISVPEEDTQRGNVSPQLMDDIGEAFKGIFQSRKKQPLRSSAFGLGVHPEGDGLSYRSKIRTPRELSDGIDTVTSKTELMANSWIEEMEGMEKNLDEERRTDAIVNSGIKELTNVMAREKSNYDSTSLYIETKYIEMKEHEKMSGNNPTRLKSSVSADLITKLCYGIERYTTIMEPLIWELLNSIFPDFAKKEKVLTRENFLVELSKMKTYFELYHEVHDALEEISDELDIIQQGMRLKDLVKKFQTVRLAFNEEQSFIRDICFKAWKILWVRGRRLRKIAKRRGLRYRWNLWRKFVTKRQERELEEYSNELDQKIHRLVELNNLIATQSQNMDEEGIPDTKNVISFGTASIIDPTLLPSPINTAVRQSIAQRKSIISNISRKVSKNFETVTIATTPSMRRIMSSSFAINVNTVPSNDEKAFNSYNLEPTLDEKKLIETVEKAVKISADIAIGEKIDQITQTPDEWMLGINETNLLSHLSVSKSFAVPRLDSGDPLQSDSVDEISIGGYSRRSSVHKYQLNALTACQLIAFIYENRYADMLGIPEKADFNRTVPLLQYAKQLLMKRYSLRRLAQKFYRGLIASCTRESVHHKRLELFGILAGIPLADKVDTEYDSERCTFFFRILSFLFRRRLDHLANTFASKEIDRALVLTLMPDIFADVKESDIEYYQNIVYDIVDLPSTDPDMIDRVYKVDIDEVLSIMMDAYETKHKKHIEPELPLTPLKSKSYSPTKKLLK